MDSDIFTFIVGGKAGEGVKKAGSVAAHIFSGIGRHVFQMDDYMSLIRGGHNFSVVSTTPRWISSHYMKANLVVNFDKRSCETHVNDIAKNGIMIYNSDEQERESGIGIPLTSEAEKFPMKSLMYGVGAVAILSATIGFEKNQMNQIIESQYPRGIEDNISFAYDQLDQYNVKVFKSNSIKSKSTHIIWTYQSWCKRCKIWVCQCVRNFTFVILSISG